MFIIDSDKRMFVNLDNIFEIYICSEDNDNYSICVKDNRTTIILDKYKTEERAKEILKEIIRTRAKFEIYKTLPSGGIAQTEMLEDFTKEGIIFDTYEMPRE